MNADATPPDGPLRSSRMQLEVAADTALVEGAFPRGSGFIRLGTREAQVDVILQDLDAACRLLAAVAAVVRRLDVQMTPRTAPPIADQNDVRLRLVDDPGASV